MWVPAGVMLAGSVTESRAATGALGKAGRVGDHAEGPQRVASQKIDEVLSSLSLEVRNGGGRYGAGSGLFSRPMAKAVAPAARCTRWIFSRTSWTTSIRATKKEKIRNVPDRSGRV